MTGGMGRRPVPLVSTLLGVGSVTATVLLILVLDAIFVVTAGRALDGGRTVDDYVLMVPVLNATAILQSVIGALIERRRPGHAIGRLLMASGILYAGVAGGWMAVGAVTDPGVLALAFWALTIITYPVFALLAGWLPLLYPTGSLPGRRWRLPAAAILVVSCASLAALVARPGPVSDGGPPNPLGIDAWPSFLQWLVDGLFVQLVALVALGVASLVARYVRGDTVERLQIRWFVAALSITGLGFVGVIVENAVRTDGGDNLSTALVFAGLLATPVAIGIAILRYRLYEIDRLISRTIGWAAVTGILAAVFVVLVVTLQALLSSVTDEDTLAVAVSTLVAFALFQPLRRRVQRAVDRRFDRVRYDGERTAAAFADRLRGQVDLVGLERDLSSTVAAALSPASTGVWLRGARS